MITAEVSTSGCRMGAVLAALGVPRSSWYRCRREAAAPRGRKPQPVPAELREAIGKLAGQYPWWGYKRIAVVARRAGIAVSNQQVYRIFREGGLLQRKPVREAAVYQALRLFELLPAGPDELWQMDVTYLHIPGHGWWYAVTVIDYYSRYLLACYFTFSYSAQQMAAALDLARAEAERQRGPLRRQPVLVTDNGSSFLAKGFRQHIGDGFAHVRIQYRTPAQLGLLERFHQTLKTEAVYWKLYTSPGEARESLEQFRARHNEVRPHWALRPEAGGDPHTPREVYVDGCRVGLPRWQGWAKAAREKLAVMIGQRQAPAGRTEEPEPVSLSR